MKKVFTLLIAVAMLLFTGFVNAQTITIGDADPTACGTIDVPVTVSGFANVGAISLVLNYDATVFEIPVVTMNGAIVNPAINTGTAGQIKIGWNSLSGVSLADGLELFSLDFTMKPANSATTKSFTWDFAKCELAAPNATVYSTSFVNKALTIPTRPVKNINTGLEYCNIPDAVYALQTVNGHTITVADGNYVLASTLNISKQLTITGESEAGVIIDAAGNGTGYAIKVEADNVTLENFTILPPVVSASLGTSSGGGFAIHASFNHDIPYSMYNDLTLQHITIENGNRTSFDIHGYDGVILDHLTAKGNAYGNGISLTGCKDAEVTNSTTSGNTWGGIAVYCSKAAYLNTASSDITIDFAQNSIGEFVYIEDEFGLVNTGITVSNWTYGINNDYDSGTANYTAYTDKDKTFALGFGTGLNTKLSNMLSYVWDTSLDHFFVGPGMAVQRAVEVATADDFIEVSPGEYDEVGQIVIDKNLTITGVDKSTTIIKPAQNTGSSEDSRGWFLVEAGNTFNLSNVTLDGDGLLVNIGILSHGPGTIDNCILKNLGYNPSTSYAGRGIAMYDCNMTISNNHLSNIGRIGIFMYGTGVNLNSITTNTYVGKGGGNWLDYGIEVEGGAVATITNNTISDCLGVASLDGSTSAGILATTYFAPGTTANISGGSLTNNTVGVAVGYGDTDASIVTIANSKIYDNIEFGVSSTNPIVNAIHNWWGVPSGPYNNPKNLCGLGNAVSANVDFISWWTDEAMTVESVTGGPVEFGGPVSIVSTVECIANAVAPALPIVKDYCGNVVAPSAAVIGGGFTSCEGTKTYTYTYTDALQQQMVWTYTYTIDLTTDPEVPADGGSTVECLADAVVPTLQQVDQQQLVFNNYVSSFNNSVSQSFTAGMNGFLTGVDVDVYDLPGGSQTFALEVYEGDGISGTKLCRVEDLTVSSRGWKHLAIPVNIAPFLTQGIKYTFYMVGYEYNSWRIKLVYAETNYTGGQMLEDPETENTDYSIIDLVFKTYMSTSASAIPLVIDACGNNIVPQLVSTVEVPEGVSCNGTKTYNYTYTDCAGNVIDWKYVYTIQHSSAPEVPEDGASTVECLTEAVAPTTPEVTDVCGTAINPVLVSTVDDPDPITCEGTRTYTYSYTDCASLVSVWKFVYTIKHSTLPIEVDGPVENASIVACATEATEPTTLPAVQDVCGNVLSPGTAIKQVSIVNTFDEAIALADATADDVWYTDRYAPEGFEFQVEFGGDMRLKHSIAAEDGASSRPSSYSSSFYNTQGRKLNLGTATTEISVKLYIPSEWATTNRRMAGLWGTAVNADDAISGYPIVEFTSDEETPRFRVWESSTGWFDIGLPTEFAYDSWITLKIRLLPSGEFLCSAGSLFYATKSSTADESVRFDNVILQGHNTTEGVDYDIYWDDFTYNNDYESICEGAITYTYEYEDCAGLPYVWTYTYTVVDGVAPTITGPADVVVNMNDGCTAINVELGTPTTGDNCNGALTVTDNRLEVYPVGETIVTWTVKDCAGNEKTSTQKVTVVRNTLSGILAYHNEAVTPMNLVTLQLFDSNNVQVGDDVVTGDNGEYAFPNLCAGTYSIVIVDNQKDVGGINSTDAGAANYWATYPSSIEHVKFLAGDVNDDYVISSTDASKIQLNFVFDTPFGTPEWSYWKQGEMIQGNDNPYDAYPESGPVIAPWPTAITVVVSGNVSDCDLFGMATGDFNGSLIPTTEKSASRSLSLDIDKNMQIGVNQEFELPLRAVSRMEIGAVSMVLDIPTNLVEVLGVKVNGSEIPVAWVMKGEELRIGWNSVSPVNVASNGDLVTLQLKSTKAFTTGQFMNLNLVHNPLNELADGNYEVIRSATLLAAKVGNGLVNITENLDNSGLSFSNYPNPFNRATTLEYTIPVDGKVNINVYNQLGQLVTTVMDAHQNAGRYSINDCVTNLVPGVYIAKLRLTNSTDDMISTIKLKVLK